MYEFLITRGGYEQRVSFRAESEAEARKKAQRWAGKDGVVGHCTGYTKIEH